MKKLLYFLLLLLAVGLGLFLGSRSFFDFKTENVVRAEGTVLLEKVQRVAKMITVEGYFSELYDHKEHYWYDISPLRKKAILKIAAKVSIGYDLQKMEFEVKPLERVLIINYFPDPEVLSIDTDVSYYDLQEGLFNQFDEKGLTQLHVKAKELIREKANSSDLMLQAEDQANEIRDLIYFIAEESGWTVKELTRMEYEDRPKADTMKEKNLLQKK